MKKQILSFIVLGMSLMPFAASAQQSQKIGKSQKPATECCGQAGCDQNKENCNPEKCPAFEGITLTPEQQTKLKALHEKRATARPDKQKAKKEDRKENRGMNMEARRDDQRAYLDEVKKILTPEQYTKFLENMAVNEKNGPRHHGMHQDMRRPAPAKDGAVQGKKSKRTNTEMKINGTAKKAEKAEKSAK